MKRSVFLGENLKYHRTKCSYTQRELADMLGFTEKSVSKWENGSGMPNIDTLIKLSDIFGVSIDELVFEKKNLNYFLGIDGGGTKTVFCLSDENGQTIRSVIKGATNPNDVGMENTFSLLKEGIAEVCAGIPYCKVTMFAGIAGGGLSGENEKTLNNFFKKFGFYAYDNASDIDNIRALSNNQRCILVIMGTGFIVFTVQDEKLHRIAGWGQLFDEGGSGYTIAKKAISAVLCEGDKSGEATLLTKLLYERIGESAEEHLDKFYKGGKQYIASFCDIVFEAANRGDAVANQILEENMQFVASMINTAVLDFKKDEAIPIFLFGGISKQSEILLPLIQRNIKNQSCSFKVVRNEQVEGALINARRIFEKRRDELC